MDDDDFFEYIQKTIMKLFPDAAPVRGRWVILKCDSGPGRLNPTLLAYLRFHGFILYPGVPNTTAVTQETDQSYGPFQTAVRTNLQVIIDERITANKTTTLSPWIIGLVVFGGEDPETGLIVGSAFDKGFSKVNNIKAWGRDGPHGPRSPRRIEEERVGASGDDDEQRGVRPIGRSEESVDC
jgi:hypothetical protein